MLEITEAITGHRKQSWSPLNDDRLTRSSLPLIMLLLASVGCSQTFSVVGYSSAEPVVASAGKQTSERKVWPEKLLHTGCEIDGWLGRDGRWGHQPTI